ncbi:MAG: hypothetical protein AAF773_23275 [Cyanobacteria bacterium P01_D01_bin.115]
MSKTPSDQTQNFEDELSPEYHFDYQKVKPNRFAIGHKTQKATVVVLDEDVAQVFTTPESVNKVLRALIESMPQSAGDETA